MQQRISHYLILFKLRGQTAAVLILGSKIPKAENNLFFIMFTMLFALSLFAFFPMISCLLFAFRTYIVSSTQFLVHTSQYVLQNYLFQSFKENPDPWLPTPQE